MLTRLAQVARTYRTNALWHSGEEIWKRRSRHASPNSSLPAITTPAIQNCFEPYAQAAAQGLSHVLLSAVQLKECADSLAQENDSDSETTSDMEAALPANEEETTSLQQHAKELVQRNSAFHQAMVSASRFLHIPTVQEALGNPYSESLEQLGIRQQSEAADDTLPIEERQDPLLLHSTSAKDAAANLSAALGRLLSLPPAQLLDKKQSKFQSIMNYQFRQWNRSQVHTYLPIPLTGMLVNQYL